MKSDFTDSKCTGHLGVIRATCLFERPCKRCRQTIHFVQIVIGDAHPFDPDGGSHYLTCPNAEEFRRKHGLPTERMTSPAAQSLFDASDLDQGYPD